MDGFRGDWVTPKHEDYVELIQRCARNAIKRASVVACVKDEGDVLFAMEYAKRCQLDIAVKCGGHSVSGASSTEGGLIIDLSRYLIGIVVLPGAEAIKVGGGCRFAAIEQEAMRHGKMVVSGTVNDTGVGGLSLGGGYGFLTGEHSLALDNILGATIVTGSGEVLDISGSDDLFWAIRGGGGNFGVVTSFTIALHAQRETVFAGVISFDLKYIHQVFDYARKWYDGVPSPKSAMPIHLQASPPLIAVTPFYNGSEEEGRAYFRQLLDIPCVEDDTQMVPFTSLNSFPGLKPINSYIKGAKSLVPTHETIDRLVEHVSRLPTLSAEDDFGQSSSRVIFEFFPIEKKASIPVSATAYAHRGLEPMTSILLYWDEDASRKKYELARAWAHTACEIIEGPDGVPGYGNYETEVDQTSKTRAMFGTNYGRLQRIKFQYDLDNLFNKWFPIGIVGGVNPI